MIACPLFATEGKVMTHQIRGDSGCHRREGIFLAQGPKIKQGVALQANNILDLAPTIMHLLGQPVPEVMDGRVVLEIFAEAQDVVYGEKELATELATEESFAAEEAAQVEDRLRGLGYL
jgi:hypothetical protein